MLGIPTVKWGMVPLRLLPDLGQTGQQAKARKREYVSVGEVKAPVILGLGLPDRVGVGVRLGGAITGSDFSDAVTSGAQVVPPKRWVKRGIGWNG